MKKRYGNFYKRRSQIYSKLRTKKLSSGEYLVEHEPSKLEFYVFKTPAEDWAVRPRHGAETILSGFRTKNKVMEALEKEGPRFIRVA